MPNIKAAEKWVRQSSKRTTQNKEVTSRLKTLFKSASGGDLDATEVESAFDRAARKRRIHPNKAARKKSRLAKSLLKPASAAKAQKSRKTASKKKP